MTRTFRLHFGSYLAVCAAPGLVACGEPPTPAVVIHEQVLTARIQGPSDAKAVDILFVIDDSVSMAGEQANLAANFGSFIDVLEDPLVEADYRIAVTTSDSGNPRCLGPSSDHGALLMSSCMQRQGDFVNGDLDVRGVACNDHCTLSAAELEILPTTTEHGEQAKPRPWLESIGGKTNLPAGVSMSDAFDCFAPQGIAGCDFEAPLESMDLAFDRMLDAADPAYGFLREEAVTMIVFMTDGHDCSHAEEWADIFSPAGNHVFWSDPSAAEPTSAVCWNAGVECTGEPSHYASCDATDKDIEGELASTADRAVMRPVAHYIDRLQQHEDLQQERDPQREVIVATVGGVANDGSAYFADADDPGFQDEYGIGPGCTGPGDLEGVPPVRLLEFGEAFTSDNAFSICNADYTPALQAIADKIHEQIRPACFPGCVEDVDLASDVLEPECIVMERPLEGDHVWVEECQRDADGRYGINPATMDYSMPAGDVDVCYAILTDPSGQTGDIADDMSMECTDLNYNLEFKISRRPGHPSPRGTSVYASCVLSDRPQADCYGLGTPG